MQRYLAKVQSVRAHFKGIVLEQIPRRQNSHADSLVMLATSLELSLPQVVVIEEMDTSNLTRAPLTRVYSLHVGPSWMDPIINFLKGGSLPQDKLETEKVCKVAPHYQLFEEQKLYKCSYLGPYLLCVHSEAVEPLLEELHEGIYGSYTRGRSIAHRALIQGYWWLSMRQTSQDYAKRCNQCQRYAPNIHQLGGILNPLSSPWPFAQWGLDIMGPFPRSIGNRRWLLVGMDYFIKWVEVEPFSNIRDMDAKKFVQKNIVTRFGVPCTLISDNGLQFYSKTFQRYQGSWGSGMDILHLPILRGMGRPRPRIKLQWPS